MSVESIVMLLCAAMRRDTSHKKAAANECDGSQLNFLIDVTHTRFQSPLGIEVGLE
jgi:hypothetical protein